MAFTDDGVSKTFSILASSLMCNTNTRLFNFSATAGSCLLRMKCPVSTHAADQRMVIFDSINHGINFVHATHLDRDYESLRESYIRPPTYQRNK